MSDLKTTLRQASAKKPKGLQDVLMRGTSGGPTLGQTSTEGIQQLAAKSGRPLPPTDPTSAQQLGATPQQAAMAGSSANLKSTLQMAASDGAAPPSLQDTLRTEQARTQKSAAEMEQEALAGRLAQGTTQATSEAVGAGAHRKFEEMSVDEIKLKLAEEHAYLNDTATPDQITSLTKALQGDPNLSLDDIQNIATIQNPQGDGTLVSADDNFDSILTKMKDVFGASEEAVIQAAAGAVEDYEDFNVADFYDDEGDIKELAAALGITEEELIGGEDSKGMSIGELQAALAANIEEEYSRVENLEGAARDANLSPMERAQARKSLRDAGATGVIATEEGDVGAIADSVANADTIMVGDQEITVEELLSDDYISGLVSNYIEGIDGADEAIAELGEGGLKDFVDENKALLEGMVENIDTNVKEYADVQVHNDEEYADLVRVVGQDVADLFTSQGGHEGLTGLSASRVDIPLLDKTELATQVVADIDDPAIRSEFLDADAATLDKWDTLNKMGSPSIAKFKESNDFKNKLKAAQAGGIAPEQVFKDMVGMDLGKMQQKKKMAALGLLPLSPEESRSMEALLGPDGNLRGDWMDNAIAQSANSLADIDRDNLTASELQKGSRYSPQAASSIGHRILEQGGINPDGSLHDNVYQHLSIEELDSMDPNALAAQGINIDPSKIPEEQRRQFMETIGNTKVNEFKAQHGISDDMVDKIHEAAGRINVRRGREPQADQYGGAREREVMSTQLARHTREAIAPLKSMLDKFKSIQNKALMTKPGGGPASSHVLQRGIQQAMKGLKDSFMPYINNLPPDIQAELKAYI